MPNKFTEDLTFRDVSAISLKRALRWHNGSLAQWSPLEWAGAMCGEAGEAANVAKKLRRLELQISSVNNGEAETLRRQLASEIAGTFIYLDLLAQRCGIDLAGAVREEFNRVSERENFPERL